MCSAKEKYEQQRRSWKQAVLKYKLFTLLAQDDAEALGHSVQFHTNHV